MYPKLEQVVANNKTGMEMLLKIVDTQFAAFERLSALNLQVTKVAVEAGVAQVKALLGAKTVQEWVSVNMSAAQPNAGHGIAYARSVYALAAQTQGEFTKMMETQGEAFYTTMAGFLDTVTHGAPAGSEAALAAVRSALAATSSAYDRMIKVAQQATEMADANFTAAATLAKDPRKRAA